MNRRDLFKTLAVAGGLILVSSAAKASNQSIIKNQPSKSRLTPVVLNAIRNAAYRWAVPIEYALAVAKVESNFNPDIVSPKGAIGLFQLMPATAEKLGVTNPFDITQNAEAGCKYLAMLNKYYDSWGDAFMAYNWGMGNLNSNKKVPQSVIDYSNKVTITSAMFENFAPVRKFQP